MSASASTSPVSVDGGVGERVNHMTHQERERETIRRLREEWEAAHRAERLRQRETEARAHAPIRLDEEAQILFELSRID